MAKVIYSEQAFSDFERLSDFLAGTDLDLAFATVDAIQEGIAILERHPLIGRPVEHELRELVISRGKTGYVALYAYLEDRDVALVLAIRHQREAGYAGARDLTPSASAARSARSARPRRRPGRATPAAAAPPPSA